MTQAERSLEGSVEDGVGGLAQVPSVGLVLGSRRELSL